MATLNDLLIDKTKSDEVKVTIEGAETTLGELRRGMMFQSDYTKKTQRLADEQRDFEKRQGEWEYARIEAENKLAEFAKQLMEQNPGMTRREAIDEATDDPRMAKVMAKVDTYGKELEGMKALIHKQEETIKAQTLAHYADQHRRALAYLKQQDPKLDPDDLIAFAKREGVPNLLTAYKAYRADDLVAEARTKAREEGLQEGIKRGKSEATQPLIPSRRVVSSAPKDAPRTWDEAVDAALGDPDVMKTFSGDS